METVLADRFVLQSEIARGAVGIVWRGVDRVTGEAVAVKVLRGELRGETEIVESFFAEAEILNAIDHPGVVGVRDFIVTDEVLAVVLEHLEGPDLREYLRQGGPMSQAEAARRCASAAETIAAVHRAGYLHGDIKPGNLMLTSDGVKFIDFGIARPAGSTTTPSHGTPEYTAPEVAAGESACPGIDSYALGLVLYEAVTARSAYRGGSITDVLDRHMTKIPVKPAAVDAELWEVVETLLALDPKRRGDLDGIAAELRRLAPRLSEQASAPVEPGLRDREATSAVEYSPVTPAAGESLLDDILEAPEPPSRRRRGLALAGAGALGLAAIAAIVLFALPRGETGGGEDVADEPGTSESAEEDPTAGESDGPSPEPSEAPSEEGTDAPTAEGPEADSAPDATETDDLSGSEGENGADDSNEGSSGDDFPGGDLIGSRMPGN
ncbi:protein kinase domain-containing protein [Glycomyces salinus]|uniref:protein kinase domain-containing protein n=1 Tax=Glycomyces salinus TaxID=980294 RepID=UPI0018EB9840|nr:serine/threonine-protein kinase [Glycomyces salinus]